MAIGSLRSAVGVSLPAEMTDLEVPVPCEPSFVELLSRRRSPGSVLEIVACGVSEEESDRRTADSGGFCSDGVKLGGSLGRIPRAIGWLAEAAGAVVERSEAVDLPAVVGAVACASEAVLADVALARFPSTLDSPALV